MFVTAKGYSKNYKYNKPVLDQEICQTDKAPSLSNESDPFHTHTLVYAENNNKKTGLSRCSKMCFHQYMFYNYILVCVCPHT